MTVLLNHTISDKICMHTCIVYHITQALPTLLVILNAATLYQIVSVHYILYSVHGIMTVLLNHTISDKIGMDVDT